MYAGYEHPYGGGGGEMDGERFQFRPASRSGTPRSLRAAGGGGGGMYPTYSNGPHATADTESVYEEHDITTMFAATGNNGTWQQHQNQAGPSTPKPARSSYSSPPPVSMNAANRYRASLDTAGGAGMMYASPLSPAPSSAPAAYPPYGAYSMYYPGGEGQEDWATQPPPGAFPSGPHSEPNPDEYYWYAGPPVQPPAAPASIASSHTMYGGGGANYGSGNDPAAATFFGVRAPHHLPGTASSRRGGGGAIRGENLPNFPQWSRTWYDGHLSANGHAYTNVPPPVDGMSGWESADTLTRSGGAGMMPGSYGHVYGMRQGNVADMVKEERIKMLEKQFGKPKIAHKNGEGGDHEDFDDDEDRHDSDSIEDDELPLGAVNSRGKLVTERPKWKLIARWLIGITSLACFALGIGSALLIKPGQNPPAARGSMASYVVYIASALTLIIILYLYVFRPCCCDPIRKDIQMGGGPGGDNPLAGMVIPILSGGGPGMGGGGKMKKGPFKGKRGRMMMGQAPAPTVNLIVDPALLGMGGGGGGKKGRKNRKGAEMYDSDEDDDDDERLPGDARRSSKRKNGVGVLGNIQMQRRWMMARKTLKLETIWDSILFVLWIAVLIVALGLGKKCPPGAGNGWCNYYNGAIACGAILAALFAFTIYLDYRDLKSSKKPPKPPM